VSIRDSLFAFFAVKTTPSIGVNSRPFAVPIPRASVPPCLCEKKPAAGAEGDKVADKARDKVDASPITSVGNITVGNITVANGLPKR
jgi:hypothetical protein